MTTYRTESSKNTAAISMWRSSAICLPIIARSPTGPSRWVAQVPAQSRDERCSC
jgi:hypothetical protein